MPGALYAEKYSKNDIFTLLLDKMKFWQEFLI